MTPEQLDRSLVDATVALSATFWDDGRPSSFIAFAAVVAHLAAGRTAEAHALVAHSGTDDWFSLASGALTASAQGAPEAALELLERAGAGTTLPRLQVITGVLAASILTRSGLAGAAAARLDTLWATLPAPRLLRFALRFLHADEFASLAAVGTSCAPGVVAVLRASAEDRRPASAVAPPALSPVEREILTLLRRGLGNADLATARGVSHNTIRTQIRLLYRKARRRRSRRSRRGRGAAPAARGVSYARSRKKSTPRSGWSTNTPSTPASRTTAHSRS